MNERIFILHLQMMFLLTSFTTAAAFLTNALSIIMPVRLFGIYIATIVTVNYLLILTWFPACLILWSRFEDRYKCGLNISKWKGKISLSLKQAINWGSEKLIKRSLIKKQSKLRTVERFFHDTYGPFVVKFRFVILVLFSIIMV